MESDIVIRCIEQELDNMQWLGRIKLWGCGVLGAYVVESLGGEQVQIFVDSSRLVAAAQALQYALSLPAPEKKSDPPPKPNAHLSVEQCMVRIKQAFPKARLCTYPHTTYRHYVLLDDNKQGAEYGSIEEAARGTLYSIERHNPEAFSSAGNVAEPKQVWPARRDMTWDQIMFELGQRGCVIKKEKADGPDVSPSVHYPDGTDTNTRADNLLGLRYALKLVREKAGDA